MSKGTNRRKHSQSSLACATQSLMSPNVTLLTLRLCDSQAVTLLVTHNSCAKEVRSVGLQVEPRLHSNGRAAAFPVLAVPTGIIPGVARRSCAEEGRQVRLQYTPVSAIESVTRRKTLTTSITFTLLVTHSPCAQDVRSVGLLVEPTLHGHLLAQ